MKTTINNISFIILLLSNIVFAGTMTNPTINTGQGGRSTFGKGGNGGNVYNDKIINTSTDKSKNLDLGVQIKK